MIPHIYVRGAITGPHNETANVYLHAAGVHTCIEEHEGTQCRIESRTPAELDTFFLCDEHAINVNNAVELDWVLFMASREYYASCDD